MDNLNDLRLIRCVLEMGTEEYKAWYEDQYGRPFGEGGREAVLSTKIGSALGMLDILILDAEARA